MNTKEKIIYESLNLFSTKGFDAISVRDIANAVGIKASSIYNHFKSKYEIFDTIIGRYSEHINNFFHYMKMDTNQNNIMINKFEWVSDEQFFKKIITLFKFYLEDEYVVKFRKILTIEQYNSSKIAILYNKLFIDDILTFHTTVFENLINLNILIKRDPYTLALQFYSPLFLMFSKCECITDKELIYLRKHISEFKDIYTMKG